MEIKLINYLLLTYRMRHGDPVEEEDTERDRERAAKRRGEAGEWRALAIGTRRKAKTRETRRESVDSVTRVGPGV
jgi:hypothetical protein